MRFAFGVILLFGMLTLSVEPAAACPQLAPVQPVTAQQQEIYRSLLNGFAVYESFVSERDEIGDLLLLKHGYSVEQAQHYLQKGLTCSLSNDLLLTYTRWNEEHQRLQLMPSDGIPILTEADFDVLYFRMLDDGSIVFQRDYKDCYRNGDIYHFQVTGRKQSSGWLIQSFTLTECPLSPANACASF